MYHIPTNTIPNALVKPKDPSDRDQQCGVIYHLECKNCENYVGEMARALAVRVKEHARTTGTKTAVGEHLEEKGHTINTEKTKIIYKEDNTIKRKVKEAIKIIKRQPTLNKDPGYELPPIYHHLVSRHRLGSRDTVH